MVKTVSETHTRNNPPWWRLPTTTWFLLGVLALWSGICCFHPMLLDATGLVFVRMIDFRYWPWWFFAALLAVVAFSVRWFLTFVAFYNEEMNAAQCTESVRFCYLTGTLSGTLLGLAILDRAHLLRAVWYSLYAWLGFGSFSLTAFASFFILLAVIAVHIILVWKWIIALQHRR